MANTAIRNDSRNNLNTNSELMKLASKFIKHEDKIYEFVTDKELYNELGSDKAEDRLTELNLELFSISKQAQGILPMNMEDIIALTAMAMDDSSARAYRTDKRDTHNRQVGQAVLYAQQYIRHRTNHPIAKVHRHTDMTNQDKPKYDHLTITVDGLAHQINLPVKTGIDIVDEAARHLERQHSNIKQTAKFINQQYKIPEQEKVFA